MPSPDSAARIRPRDLAAEPVPEGGGVECFDTAPAQQINRARLDCVAQLGLSLRGKRVLDVGCGVGHLGQWFAGQGCVVTCLDGRPENIASLRQRYPTLAARVADAESDLREIGRFELVFCFGLLYHLENPLRALRNMAAVCDEALLLETMVCDHDAPLLLYDEETKTVSQALHGLGCRPTPHWLALALCRVGFTHVYQPTVAPRHEDFEFALQNDLAWTRAGHPLRMVFVAARRPLVAKGLRSVL